MEKYRGHNGHHSGRNTGSPVLEPAVWMNGDREMETPSIRVEEGPGMRQAVLEIASNDSWEGDDLELDSKSCSFSPKEHNSVNEDAD